MKPILTITALTLSVMLSVSLRNKAWSQNVDASISYQTFYDELTPHGQWIDYPEYGYVWAPNLGGGFQPYSTGGHWVWSDEYEWMWVSDYSWGWGPFHYGRWFHDPFYGWMWVPGYTWSPAWVSWRTGGDYYGWAPIRPGINISIGFGNYNPPSHYWCFVPRRYINSRRIGNYYVNRSRNTTILNNTSFINHNRNRNNIFINGPRRQDAERYTGRIRSVSFRESNRPGGREFRNNQVSLYRPQIQRDNNRNFAPGNFDRYNREGRNNGNAIRSNNAPQNNTRRVERPQVERNNRAQQPNRGEIRNQSQPQRQINRQPQQQVNRQPQQQQVNRQPQRQVNRQPQQQQVNRQPQRQVTRQPQQQQVNRQPQQQQPSRQTQNRSNNNNRNRGGQH